MSLPYGWIELNVLECDIDDEEDISILPPKQYHVLRAFQVWNIVCVDDYEIMVVGDVWFDVKETKKQIFRKINESVLQYIGRSN